MKKYDEQGKSLTSLFLVYSSLQRTISFCIFFFFSSVYGFI